MDNLIDLSIIIPCHNLEKYIFPLLNSFQMMDFSTLKAEFIFVLDACIDNTEQIIHENMHEFNYRVYKCNYKSCGLARNFGFLQSKGKYIWFVDGDDWLIYPYTARDCIKILKQEKLQLIQMKFVSNFFNREFYSMVWQYIFDRDLIIDIKFPSKQPDEDCDFMQQVFNKMNGEEINYYIVPSYFYNYKRPGSNMTQMAEKGFIN